MWKIKNKYNNVVLSMKKWQYTDLNEKAWSMVGHCE